MASSVSSTSGTGLSLTGSPHMNGLSSGLDIDSLVNAAIQADSIPMQLLQNKNTKLQAQLNDYNSIKTSLFTLMNAAKDLTYANAFSTMKTATSDDGVVTAVAKNGSNANTYNIQVGQMVDGKLAGGMATASNIIGGQLAISSGTKATLTTSSDISGQDKNTAFNSAAPVVLGGTVHAGSFTVNGKVINVTETDTINSVLTKISASAAGVTASIVTNADNTQNIVLTQKTAGATPSIKLGADSSGFLTAVGLDAATLSAGKDADNAVNFSDLSADNPLNSITTGYFSINGTYIYVDKTTDSLDDVINKINSSGAGVSAFYDSTNKKVTLVSDKVGSANDITFGTDDTTNFLSIAKLTDGTWTEHNKGADAYVTINGVEVTPENNTVTWNGVTFTLNGTGNATVTVNNDVDATVKKVQDFIAQYNSTIDLINGKLSEKPDTTSNDVSVGDLFGDSVLRDISTSLRSFSYMVVKSASSDYYTLSQVGITTGEVGQSVADSKTGHLSLDEDMLRSALEVNPKSVQALFGNTLATVTSKDVTSSWNPDGTKTTFTLLDGDGKVPTNLSNVQIVVAGHTYTQVSGTPKPYKPNDTPPQSERQFSINYKTGEITFGDAPNAGDTIQVSYNYQLSEGSRGIITQMADLIQNFTQVGGTIDSITGSDGSITNQIDYNNDRIKDMQYRLELEQQSLYSRYQSMESILQSLKSQSSFITAQLASLSSSSSSK